MSEHPLDRPVWNALNGPLGALTTTRGAAVRIDPGYGPFAAARDPGAEAMAALVATLRDGNDAIALVEHGQWEVPAGTLLRNRGDLVQMVAGDTLIDESPDARVIRLGEFDVAEMTALALATEPGPWGPSTHRYGAYFGIRIDGRLAAMAGERMRVSGFAEVSAVCTWPEFRGQGLAAVLIRHVMRGFAVRGERPFLHSYAHNTGAIRLYEALGFAVRAEMHLSVLALA